MQENQLKRENTISEMDKKKTSPYFVDKSKDIKDTCVANWFTRKAFRRHKAL